jgi:hypothetical protein
MKIPKLKFNIVTFEHPSDEYTFHFYKDEAPDLCRIHKNNVPEDVIKFFGDKEHYYTSFLGNHEGSLPVTKNSRPVFITSLNEDGESIEVRDKSAYFSGSVLKKYYNSLIHNYFIAKGNLVKPNFVNDTEIWLINKVLTDSEYTVYEVFSLRVQFAHVSDKPEILITYEGKSRAFKKSVAELSVQIAPSNFIWTIYLGQFYKHDELPDEARRHYENVFPIWNFKIRDALHQSTEAPDKENRYKKFNKYITGFYSKYMNTPDFRQIIPLTGNTLLKVGLSKIGAVREDSNQLIFGGNNPHTVPIKGIQLNGPLELSKLSKIHFFYIFHSDDANSVDQLDEFFNKGLYSFKGLLTFSRVPYYVDKDFNIEFKSRTNPLPEIEEFLNARKIDTGIQYIAIYVSPISKTSADKQQKSVYYKIKEYLLKKHITSQVIEASKVNQSSSYVYSLNNIAVAILAKLNGIPWRIDAKLKNELIVGVGAYKHTDGNIQYIGSAFSFSNNGNFNRFECFRKNQVDELVGSIIRAIKEYVAVTGDINRLIIHYFKDISEKELQPIENALYNLGFDIPVFIITINKTESQDIVAFDYNWPDLMPKSGTFINVGRKKYLLFNNTRYFDKPISANDGFPFPIKLTISCTDPELIKDNRIIKELIDQVYQFSRMYWKSVRQQNLPVTIKYPEMVAEIFPYFDGNEIPPFGKDNLWFL